jgi:hypothetical protein
MSAGPAGPPSVSRRAPEPPPKAPQHRPRHAARRASVAVISGSPPGRQNPRQPLPFRSASARRSSATACLPRGRRAAPRRVAGCISAIMACPAIARRWCASPQPGSLSALPASARSAGLSPPASARRTSADRASTCSFSRSAHAVPANAQSASAWPPQRGVQLVDLRPQRIRPRPARSARAFVAFKAGLRAWASWRAACRRYSQAVTA